MKKTFTLFLILLLILSCKQENKNGIGNNQYPIQDFANLFSDKEENELTKKIITFKKNTANEICIYTIDSITNKLDTESFATKLAYDIGIDTYEKQNGLLLLIAKNNNEFAFATGNKAKKVITDSICKKISKNILIPYFSKNEFYKGSIITLDNIISNWK